MEVAIAVVCDRKTHVFLFDYSTNGWNNLSSTNGYCQLKVLQRGRSEYCIKVIEEDGPKKMTEYSLSANMKVTKTGDVIQIPATNPQPCLLGVKFRDPNEERQFLLKVGEYLGGFMVPLNPPAPTLKATDVGMRHGPPPPSHGYVPPTMAPNTLQQHHSSSSSSVPRENPAGSVYPQHYRNQPLNNEGMDYPSRQGHKDVNYIPERPGYRQPNAYESNPEVRREDRYRSQEEYYGRRRMEDERLNPPRSYYNDQRMDQYGRPVDYRHPSQDPSYRPTQDPFQRNEPPHNNYPYHQGRTPPTQRRQGHDQDLPPQSLSSKSSTLSKADFQSEMNHYSQQLASTLSSCDKTQAVRLVEMLTMLVQEQREECKDSLGVFSMSFEAEKELHKGDSKGFQLGLLIEQFDDESYPLYIEVTPNDSIDHLKLMCQKRFKLPKESQTWIYGSQIVEDKMLLRDLNITEDNDNIHVYIQHPKKVKGTINKLMDQIKDEVGGTPLPKHQSVPMESLSVSRLRGRDYPLEEQPSMRTNKRPANDMPADYLPPPRDDRNPMNQLPPPILMDQTDHSQFPPSMGREQAFHRANVGNPAPLSVIPQHSPVGGGVRVMPVEMPHPPLQQRLEEEPAFQPPQPLSDPDPPAVEVGWECSACTFRNLPYRPGCSMCDSRRPDDYIPPPDYVMTEEEKKFVDQSKQQDVLLQKMFQQEQEQRKRKAALNYDNLVQTDDQAIVTNAEPFDCPICFTEIDPGDGITLRSCLHQVCKECLHNSVTQSEHVQVPCPFDNGDYQCNEIIADREIRAVLTDEELEGLYNRGLRQAEAAARDSFHCQTTDCPGFCFYEDEVNEYKCPICGNLNCILCKAQHDGMNCQQYQDDLKIKAANDEAARQTQEMLEKLVADGEAMHCPQCRVIVTKKVGCDWIKCTVCRTEMCWATKGPRWGPGGRGDTSGGCKCGLNRKRCHPNCRNCH